LSKKRSLHKVSEHFETFFNAAMTEKMLRAKLSLHSFQKKTQKTSKKDLKLAKARLKEIK